LGKKAFETIFFEGIIFKTLEKTLICNMPWMHDEIFIFEKSGMLQQYGR
jgi:hypothetical protein